jgi:hypothetical protein
MLKNIKFSLHLDIHMKIFSYGWIDHLITEPKQGASILSTSLIEWVKMHFDNEEPIHNTGAIRVIHSTIVQLHLFFNTIIRLIILLIIIMIKIKF